MTAPRIMVALFGPPGQGSFNESGYDGAMRARAAGHAVERAEVRLPEGPIRMVGEHAVTVHLHADVDVQITVVIAAED